MTERSNPADNLAQPLIDEKSALETPRPATSSVTGLPTALPVEAAAEASGGQSHQFAEISPFSSAFWGVFFSTFITIFLAELGDKTQMATLLLSAQSQSPFTVFIGAGSALIATSLIGVLLGQWLSKRISEETLDTCAGVLLLLIAIGLAGDILSQ